MHAFFRSGCSHGLSNLSAHDRATRGALVPSPQRAAPGGLGLAPAEQLAAAAQLGRDGGRGHADEFSGGLRVGGGRV
jgi:hypothetical protein